MIAAQIKPYPAFANGKPHVATQLTVKSLNDNFFDTVTFQYTLLDAAGAWAGEATHEVTSREEYIKWDFSATGAFKIVADALGLELVSTDTKLFDFEA